LKKILFIGNGFLGNKISSISKTKNFQTFVASQKNDNIIDVRNIESVENIIRKINPDIVFNCAAITKLDEIEKNSKNAFAVNAYGAENIAKIVSKYSKRLIHISTDSVFDGKKGNYLENDNPHPINEYGKSKKLGEQFVKDISNNYIIVRTNFYGNNKEEKFLFNWILQNLKQNKKFNGFTNVFFNPLEIGNLSNSLLELSELDYTGLLHIGSDKTYSKYNFAKIIAEKLGYDSDLIIESNLEQIELTAKRPKNTSLNNQLFKKLIKNQPEDLEEWLERMKNHLKL
tara:strand:+ start:1611 stop:2468 length:858 start_codon:yes stop_codon:yes gene_type:complete